MEDFTILAEAIRRRYRYFKRPSDEEVQLILLDIHRLKSLGKQVDESLLGEIIERHISDRRHFIMDSLDMSPTVSILKQIVDAAAQQGK